MTEKEKMLRGMLYYADDSTLCADRVRAKELCHAYNQLRPSDAAGMRELLQRLLGETGETFCVTAPFWCDYGYNIELAPEAYLNANCTFLDVCRITIGARTLLGPGVQIYAVEDGGPASVAGLCSGDIIIRLNGADIATAADLTAAENALAPGCKTILIVYRAGEYHEVPVVLGELPDEDGEEDHGWCDFDNAW